MSSAGNKVSMMSAYFMQTTAAAKVSNVRDVSPKVKTDNEGFGQILDRAKDTSAQQQKVSDTPQKDYKNYTTADNNLNEKVADNGYSEENEMIDKEVTAEEVTTIVEDAPQQMPLLTENIDEAVTQVEIETDIITAATDIPATIETDTLLQDTISEQGKKIISQMAETFDISEEDIVNAMQVLGLMAADLLNAANIPQVLTQASTQEQAIDLITDSDIYASLQDLMEGAESMKGELMNGFDLSEEELQTAIDETAKSFENTLQESVDAETEEEPVFTNDLTKTIDVKTEGAPQSEAFGDRSLAEEIAGERTQVNVRVPGNNTEKSLLNEGSQSQNLFNQLVNNITDAAAEVDSGQTVSYTDRAQMENIVRQITDRITIMAGQEETSMELALHPASLGNVNILLTSGKDGITAKFTAQNQMVKEAVETQMIQLQQKFEDAGIKVTSIEITIASHGFEQNLEQGNDRRPDDSEQSRKAKGLRRINLSEISEDDAQVADDAEKIAVQMMAMNGNSVDYSA